jgi:cell division protein FtsL
MKWLLRVLLVIIFAFGLQYTSISYSEDFCSVIYTIIGILFALALNQIMAFNFTEIQNDKFIERHRNRLSKIRKLYIFLFAFATLALLLKSLSLKYEWKWIKLDVKFLIGSYLIFTLIYFIINFISLAKMKDQIDDEIRKMKRNKEVEMLS